MRKRDICLQRQPPRLSKEHRQRDSDRIAAVLGRQHGQCKEIALRLLHSTYCCFIDMFKSGIDGILKQNAQITELFYRHVEFLQLHVSISTFFNDKFAEKFSEEDENACMQNDELLFFFVTAA